MATRNALIFLLSLVPFLASCGGSGSTATSGGGGTPPPSSAREWTWMGGADTVGVNFGQGGVYGTEGVASASNAPGSRYGATSWTDASGNLWLFGGYGYSAQGSFPGSAGMGYLNDLWKYSPSAGTWTWVAGANDTSGNMGSPGVYGTLGVTAAANLPGGRVGASGWRDGQEISGSLAAAGSTPRIRTEC